MDKYNAGIHKIHEMTYDDTINYLHDIVIYRSSICYYSDLNFLSSFAKGEMKLIPAFLDFKNQNNLVSSKVDGSLVVSYEYNYNNLDFT